MADNEKYKLALLDLAKALNGRLTAVISTQARNAVSEVVAVTNVSANDKVLDRLNNPTPQERTRRHAEFQKFIAQQYKIDSELPEKQQASRTLIYEVSPLVSVTGTKATVVLGVKVNVYVKSSLVATVANDTTFANYVGEVRNFVELKKFLSGVLAGPCKEKFDVYLADANKTLKSLGEDKVERGIVLSLIHI